MFLVLIIAAQRRGVMIRTHSAPGRYGGMDPLAGMSYEEMLTRFPTGPRPRAREEGICAVRLRLWIVQHEFQTR